MKKQLVKLILIIGILSLPIITVYAIEGNNVALALANVGSYQDITDGQSAGTIILHDDLDDNYNATLGLSLSKRNWLGQFKFISRCNNSIYNVNNMTTCSWSNQSSGTYRGTTVVNSKASGVGTIYGSMYFE